jgi:DNA polymerase-4
MRFGDYTRATRSHTLLWPTAHTQTILLAVRGLVVTSLPLIQSQGLTMIGISVSNLENDDAVQLSLPFERRPNAALDAILDQVRDRFGTNALKRASLLGRDEGLVMPLLPD